MIWTISKTESSRKKNCKRKFVRAKHIACEFRGWKRRFRNFEIFTGFTIFFVFSLHTAGIYGSYETFQAWEMKVRCTGCAELRWNRRSIWHFCEIWNHFWNFRRFCLIWNSSWPSSKEVASLPSCCLFTFIPDNWKLFSNFNFNFFCLNSTVKFLKRFQAFSFRWYSAQIFKNSHPHSTSGKII